MVTLLSGSAFINAASRLISTIVARASDGERKCSHPADTRVSLPSATVMTGQALPLPALIDENLDVFATVGRKNSVAIRVC